MIGEPNPQLQNIAEIREIDIRLRDIEFKRRLCGYDPNEVQDCFTDIARRYKSVIALLLSQQGQDWQMQEMRDQVERMSYEYESLNDHCQRLRQWCEYWQTENERLRQQAAMLHSELVQRGWTGSA